MADHKPLMPGADGQVDGRGHADGSKRNRFAPGDGRPRPGRPKGASDERTVVRKVRDMPVTVKTRSGKRTRINTQEAILLTLRTKALAGDVKAIESLLKCGSAWKKDPGSGVIGVEKGPLIPLV